MSEPYTAIQVVMMPKDTNPHGSIKGAYTGVVGNITETPGVYPVTAYFYGRFSSGKQKEGTSQERQVELAKEWCKRKCIPLDETLSYFDDGLSGYHGQHRKRKDGGLALFLQACEQKRVKPDSFLLVESLDRLSREQLQEGQRLIHRLLFDYPVTLCRGAFRGRSGNGW